MAQGQGLISFWHLEFNEERSNPTICFVKFTSVKVSNNALNFLLAQYRAIFKRAYVKGSAVLLTAGLAAGQAQAADLFQNAAVWDKISAEQDLTISGEHTFSGTAADSINVYNNITINQGGELKNKGAGTVPETIMVKGDIVINSGGKITLATKNAHIAGFDLGPTIDGSDDKAETAVGTLYNKSGGTLTIGSGSSNSIIQMHSAVFEAGSQTTIKGSGSGANSTVATAAYLFAGLGSEPGRLDINKDATVDLEDFGYLGIDSKSTMTIDGTVNITASGSESFAGIRAADSSSSWSADTNSTVNLTENADITVKAGSGKANYRQGR